MWLVHFSLGFIVALVTLWIYAVIVKGKWIARVVNKQPIFHLVEGSQDIIYHLEVKPKLKFAYLSPSVDKFLGDDVTNEAFKDSSVLFKKVHPDDYDNLCKKIQGKLDYSQILLQRWIDNDGNYRWFEEYATPIYKNGHFIAVQGIIRNIDEKMKLQQDLEYRINHDTLTGIYNREYFETIFTKYNEQLNKPMGIVLFDLDELKYTNDNFGHKEGDALIKRAASLFDQFSSDTISVARIGGDEFVLLAVEQTEEEIIQLVQDIIKTIDEKNESGSNIPIKLSSGYAFTSNSVGQLPKLFSEADKNMYSNKTQRKQLLFK